MIEEVDEPVQSKFAPKNKAFVPKSDPSEEEQKEGAFNVKNSVFSKMSEDFRDFSNQDQEKMNDGLNQAQRPNNAPVEFAQQDSFGDLDLKGSN